MDEALRRFRIIRPFLEENIPLPPIARRQGLTVRTLRFWVHRYRCRGMAGLARRPRSDKGTPRVLSPHLRELTEALALETPPRTAAAVWRTVTAAAREKKEGQTNRIDQQEKERKEKKWNKGGKGRGTGSPSYPTVRRIVRAIDPALLSLAHEGGKAYSERYDLLYRRQAASPNAM
jgi:putative transposase